MPPARARKGKNKRVVVKQPDEPEMMEIDSSSEGPSSVLPQSSDIEIEEPQEPPKKRSRGQKPKAHISPEEIINLNPMTTRVTRQRAKLLAQQSIPEEQYIAKRISFKPKRAKARKTAPGRGLSHPVGFAVITEEPEETASDSENLEDSPEIPKNKRKNASALRVTTEIHKPEQKASGSRTTTVMAKTKQQKIIDPEASSSSESAKHKKKILPASEASSELIKPKTKAKHQVVNVDLELEATTEITKPKTKAKKHVVKVDSEPEATAEITKLKTKDQKQVVNVDSEPEATTEITKPKSKTQKQKHVVNVDSEPTAEVNKPKTKAQIQKQGVNIDSGTTSEIVAKPKLKVQKQNINVDSEAPSEYNKPKSKVQKPEISNIDSETTSEIAKPKIKAENQEVNVDSEAIAEIGKPNNEIQKPGINVGSEAQATSEIPKLKQQHIAVPETSSEIAKLKEPNQQVANSEAKPEIVNIKSEIKKATQQPQELVPTTTPKKPALIVNGSAPLKVISGLKQQNLKPMSPSPCRLETLFEDKPTSDFAPRPLDETYVLSSPAPPTWADDISATASGSKTEPKVERDTYDITVLGDYDENLTHRADKKIANWVLEKTFVAKEEFACRPDMVDRYFKKYTTASDMVFPKNRKMIKPFPVKKNLNC